MSNSENPIFETRPTLILELPLDEHIRISHPDQIILKMGFSYQDVGSFCYALRSSKKRKPGKPCKVINESFLKQRTRQILQLIKVLSGLLTDGGMRMRTVFCYTHNFKIFLNWADASGRHNCLSGGDATREAYQTWAQYTHDGYRQQLYGSTAHNQRLEYVRELLEASTGTKDIKCGIRKVTTRKHPNRATDPLDPQTFAHVVALNHAVFDGLCDLILNEENFPYKLQLPDTLDWPDSHLWVFPSPTWCMGPHQIGVDRQKRVQGNWAYNYEHGRLAIIDEIADLYSGRFPSNRRKVAKTAITNAHSLIDAANADAQHVMRIRLGMLALNAFLFLFYCNTGGNESVVREIETNDKIDASIINHQFRSIKFRAYSKPITLLVPTAFMPSLRRYMKLRRYLLGDNSYPYLFFTLGSRNVNKPEKIRKNSLKKIYNVLRTYIDSQLPLIGPRKLRASVSDWYERYHDASVTAKVLQSSEQTIERHYDAGSAIDHREELSLFLNLVSESARQQRVIPIQDTGDIPPLEEGGLCESFGHPEPLSDHVPVNPNCEDSNGCLFCLHRVLVACEEDARKVASAAFVMEQVILGPKHEEAIRPLIDKCDLDLEKIAAFGDCAAMVDRVRNDVFENGNLTPFFADKYQLFLNLGVIE